MVISRSAGLRSVGALACGALAMLASGCSDNNGGRSTDPSRSTPASGSTKPAAVVCNGANEVNQDDDGAVQALLQPSQLPSGQWTTAQTPPCPWALSADELLVVPACRSAAASANVPANGEARNCNGRVTFARVGGIQLDDRIEIYTSRQNVDAIRAILTAPSMPACFAAALQRHADHEPGTTVRDVRVSSFAVQPDAAALGLGFPAVDGYAADAGFADGVNITFTTTTKRSSRPVAMRVITFGSGGLMSTVTVTGANRAELDAFDLTDTLRAAAKNHRAMMGQ
jgi:hypothetical protein